MAKNIQVGIIGAAGYTGGELLRLLVNHPQANVLFANSKSQAGKPVYSVHTDLLGETDLCFSDQTHGADVLFLCSGHGESKKFLESTQIEPSCKIIDLSTDFRDQSNGFVYGLPELQRDLITTASKVANPGCFATSIELALLPLAKAGLLRSDVHVSAITGSTGAGQALSASTHFTWRNGNVSTYKEFEHQHLTEIKMVYGLAQGEFDQDIFFLPYRGNFSRGIMANVYLDFDGDLEQAQNIYQTYYSQHPFTHLSVAKEIDLKQVVNTNKCFIHLAKKGQKLLITSIIDNLLKGASGQAVQNMNLMFGLDETTGLKLKAAAF